MLILEAVVLSPGLLGLLIEPDPDPEPFCLSINELSPPQPANPKARAELEAQRSVLIVIEVMSAMPAKWI